MNKAGDFLSLIFNAQTQEKAKNSSRLFSAWENLAKKHGIARAAFHSQIQDVQRGILYINADHPGWIQILQTKEKFLLEDIRKMFPELGITGIAFKLGKSSTESAAADSSRDSPASSGNVKIAAKADDTETDKISDNCAQPRASEIDATSGYNRIKDKILVENLKSLEETLKKRKKTKK